MLNNSGSSRMDTLLKIVLIFVMSVLSFSIGAFVGKQVSDTEHRQALLESELGPSRTTASVNPHAVDEHPDKALSEEDIASLTEEFVNVEKKALEEEQLKPKHEIDPHNKHAAVKEPVKVAANQDGYKKLNATSTHTEEHQAEVAQPAKTYKNKPSVASQRVAAGKAPTKDPAKKRKPTSILPTPGTTIGKYTVQVASYATEAEAKKHALKLKTKGYSAFYIPGKVRGKNWFRVSVGLFADIKTANAFKKELTADAGIKSSFVQKIIK